MVKYDEIDDRNRSIFSLANLLICSAYKLKDELLFEIGCKYVFNVQPELNYDYDWCIKTIKDISFIVGITSDDCDKIGEMIIAKRAEVMSGKDTKLISVSQEEYDRIFNMHGDSKQNETTDKENKKEE